MTDIDVPDWVTAVALDACGEHFTGPDDAMKAALRAAMSAWVVHRGVTYFDTRDSSLPTQVDWNHPEPEAKISVYTLAKEKP